MKLDQVGVHRSPIFEILFQWNLKRLCYATDLIEFIKTEAPHFDVIVTSEGQIKDSPNQISVIFKI